MNPEAAYWKSVANNRAPNWALLLCMFLSWLFGLMTGAAPYLFR